MLDVLNFHTRVVLVRSAQKAVEVLVRRKYAAVPLRPAPPAQPSVVRESDLQPPKPLWHEDTRGRPHHGGSGRERGEPAGPLAPGAHRMLAASMQLQVSRLNSAPTALSLCFCGSHAAASPYAFPSCHPQWPSCFSWHAPDAMHLMRRTSAALCLRCWIQGSRHEQDDQFMPTIDESFVKGLTIHSNPSGWLVSNAGDSQHAAGGFADGRRRRAAARIRQRRPLSAVSCRRQPVCAAVRTAGAAARARGLPGGLPGARVPAACAHAAAAADIHAAAAGVLCAAAGAVTHHLCKLRLF